MRIEEDIKLDYADVLFRPKRSTLSSRKDVELKRTYKFKYSNHQWSGVPIIAANMDGVGELAVAKHLSDNYLLGEETKSDDGTKEFEAPHEGKCINPNRLAYLSYIEGAWSVGGSVTIWERVSKDSVWTFGNFEASLIQFFWRGESLETIDGKEAKFFPQRAAADILSNTYRF